MKKNRSITKILFLGISLFFYLLCVNIIAFFRFIYCRVVSFVSILRIKKEKRTERQESEYKACANILFFGFLSTISFVVSYSYLEKDVALALGWLSIGLAILSFVSTFSVTKEFQIDDIEKKIDSIEKLLKNLAK